MAKGENDRNVGPGVTFYKQGIEGALTTKKPGAAPKPKVKAKPPVPEKKPVSGGGADDFRAPPKKPKAPAPAVTPTPTPAPSPSADMVFSPMLGKMVPRSSYKPAGNPFDGVMDSIGDFRKKQFEKYGVTSGYKDGGHIRGDGKARVRTKGKMC